LRQKYHAGPLSEGDFFPLSSIILLHSQHRDHDDHISTLYAVDEDELGFEGEEYAETYAIYDENEIDEYWKQFNHFM